MDAVKKYELDWNYAVYVREKRNTLYKFSHVEMEVIEKYAPCSLAVDNINLYTHKYKAENVQSMQNATAILFVTGKWAEKFTVSCKNTENGRFPVNSCHLYSSISRPITEKCKQCTELSPNYRNIEYYSTLCLFKIEDDHSWRLHGITPMLCSTVILPKKIEEYNIPNLVTQVSRATRKCIRDSIWLANTSKYRETTLERMQS